MGCRATYKVGTSSLPSCRISDLISLEKLNGLLLWSGAWVSLEVCCPFLVTWVLYPGDWDRQDILWRSILQSNPAESDGVQNILWGNTWLNMSDEYSPKAARWDLGRDRIMHEAGRWKSINVGRTLKLGVAEVCWLMLHIQWMVGLLLMLALSISPRLGVLPWIWQGIDYFTTPTIAVLANPILPLGWQSASFCSAMLVHRVPQS